MKKKTIRLIHTLEVAGGVMIAKIDGVAFYRWDGEEWIKIKPEITIDELIILFLHKHFPGKSMKDWSDLKVMLGKFYEYLKEKGEV